MSLTERYCIATLPLLYNPVNKLALNKVNPKINVYKQQNRKLYLNLKDKKDALKSESKLQELGHVPYLAHLPPNLHANTKLSSKLHPLKSSMEQNLNQYSSSHSI